MQDENKVSSAMQQFDLFSKLYQSIVASIAGLQIDSGTKEYMCRCFGSGFLWGRESFNAFIAAENAMKEVKEVKHEPQFDQTAGCLVPDAEINQ